MSGRRRPDAQATVEEQPAQGGSYVREADGSLTRVEATEHSDGPADRPAGEEVSTDQALVIAPPAADAPSIPQQD